MVRGPTAVEEGAMPQTPLSALSPKSAALCPTAKSPTTLGAAAGRGLRGGLSGRLLGRRRAGLVRGRRARRPLWTLMGAVSLSLALAAPVTADSIMVPNIGTAGSLGISVPKEIAIGDFFMRTARSKMPIVDDPVLTEYVTTLGNRLLAHAANVNFPFEFFVVYDRNLNASAFLGGKVAINTGLFAYAQTEDEFASVIAHEISHVTQRHIARFIESTSMANQLSMAGLIGAVAMSILNPAMGMAAVSTTVGAMAQSRINFTRDNEYEADRLGISLLYQAGLNPQGTVDMFRRLAAMQGNINPAFTLLIDHPLSEIRVAEAQNRVAQLERRKNSTNPDYDLARARIMVRYDGHKTPAQLQTLKQRLRVNGEHFNAVLQNYALALTCFELKQYDEAWGYLDKLPGHLDSNLFVLDLKTDLDLQSGKASAAIERLKPRYAREPLNQVLAVNLANAYAESKNYGQARKLLEDYLRRKPSDVVALNLLASVQQKQNDRCALLQTRGEVYALSAAYAQAINSYNNALRECDELLTRERIKARVAQIATQRSFDEELIHN